MRSNSRRGNGWLLIATVFFALVGPAGLQADDAPPNGPARVEVDRAAGRLVLHYHGGVILDAEVTVHSGNGPFRSLAEAEVVWAKAEGPTDPFQR